MEKLSLNKKIGNYIILREIGIGSTGITYLGKDITTLKKVAIKAISLNDLSKDIKKEQSYQITMHILESINHPNIVNFISKERTKNNLYIIYDYANGGNLREYLDKYKKMSNKSLEEKYIRKIIKQVSEGLCYLHSKNIIHRDITLENFLINFDEDDEKIEKNLDSNFTIKIKDFTLAKELIEGAKAASIYDNFKANAPEVLTANLDNKYNFRADIWSLGICTYELATGNMPFHGNNNKEMWDSYSRGKYIYNKDIDISIECVKFINGLLQFDPAKRLNWDEIKNHPFLNKDEDKLTKLKYVIKDEYDNIKYFEVNSKNKDNFFWKIYNNGYQIGLLFDKLNNNNWGNIINNKYYDEKTDGKLKLNENDDWVIFVPEKFVNDDPLK